MKRSSWAVSFLVVFLPGIAWCQIGNIVVTSAASFQPGIPPKGSIASLFCTGLRVTGVTAATTTPLPETLAGVTVTIDGAPAPLFAVADLGGYQQINFQVPTDVGSAKVVVSQNGTQGSASATNDPNSPGELFRIGASQFGVFQHASDYSLVTPDNPVKAGETVIAYATGLPSATPAVPIGQPAPLSPLSHVPQLDLGTAIDTIGVSLNYGVLLMDSVPERGSGDTTGLLPIPFMGLAPGSVGLYQINFVLPQGLPPGNVPIQLVREICTGVLGCGAPWYVKYYAGQPVLLPVH